jgi:hypothetical protein
MTTAAADDGVAGRVAACFWRGAPAERGRPFEYRPRAQSGRKQMSEDRCVGCGGRHGGPPCGARRGAELCLGCGRDGAARAAAGRNEPAAWCRECRLCADCTGLVHCTLLRIDFLPERVHGNCEACHGRMCGDCARCDDCCRCGWAGWVPPTMCRVCNLRPAPPFRDGGGASPPCDGCRAAR